MDKFIEQQAGLMTFSFRSTKSNVSPDTWTKLEQELDKDLRDAREEIITNYEVAYTLDEIKALNAFYESPVRRKELTTRPFLTQHVVQILQRKTDRIANAAGRETGTQKK